MPRREISSHSLHVRLLKTSVSRFDQALEDPTPLKQYDVRSDLGFEGKLYVEPPAQGAPPWLEFVQTGIDGEIGRLINRSNSAVLLVYRSGRIFAFPFGHGRFLLRPGFLVPDFGLRTALNSLDHSSLRSLDSFTIEDQTVHTRAQTSRASGLQSFGLDVGKDILRAVTGLPKSGIKLQSVSGSESSLAVIAPTDFKGLGPLCDMVLGLYKDDAYREHFAWVDNIRRVRDDAKIDKLDRKLIQDLKRGAVSTAYLAPPEPIEWQDVRGFSYTHSKRHHETDMNLNSYLSGISLESLDAEAIKNDRVFQYGPDDVEPSDQWSVYKCLVFETSTQDETYALSAGIWFEVDKAFARRIRARLSGIPTSSLKLPRVFQQDDGHLEPEGDYNRRASGRRGSVVLMDQKLAACAMAGDSIEFCDLLSISRHLVHVKHRKGGSSSLSHLFAQARVSAEAFLSDENFREGVRDHLAEYGDRWQRLIPARSPVPALYRIVFAILGVTGAQPGSRIPFFSQLNLVRTYESLASRGFGVEVLGIPVRSSG